MKVFVNNKNYEIKNENLINIINDFIKIKSIDDLKKRKLELYDYNLLKEIINDLVIKNESNYFLTNPIINHLKKFNIKIDEKVKNTCYKTYL